MTKTDSSYSKQAHVVTADTLFHIQGDDVCFTKSKSKHNVNISLDKNCIIIE